MNPNDIERELRSLLSVDPAPGFQARVRERIDREAQPRGWSFTAMFAGAGLVAAVVLGVFVFLPRGGPGTNVQQPPAVIATEAPRPAVVIASPPEPPKPHWNVTKQVKPEPQLMIAANEASALRRLLSGEVKELPGRFEPPVREFHVPDPVVMPLDSPAPINIEPLVLPPPFEDIRR